MSQLADSVERFPLQEAHFVNHLHPSIVKVMAKLAFATDNGKIGKGS